MRTKSSLLAAAAATLTMAAVAPAVAGPADAPCVYLAIGCAPNESAPYPETAMPGDEPAPVAPRHHHRRRRVGRHRTILHATF